VRESRLLVASWADPRLAVYPHHGKTFFAILAALLAAVAIFVVFGASEIASRD